MFWWPPNHKLDILPAFKRLSILLQNAISVLKPVFQQHKISRVQHSLGKIPLFNKDLMQTAVKVNVIPLRAIRVSRK